MGHIMVFLWAAHRQKRFVLVGGKYYVLRECMVEDASHLQACKDMYVYQRFMYPDWGDELCLVCTNCNTSVS